MRPGVATIKCTETAQTPRLLIYTFTHMPRTQFTSTRLLTLLTLPSERAGCYTYPALANAHSQKAQVTKGWLCEP